MCNPQGWSLGRAREEKKSEIHWRLTELMRNSNSLIGKSHQLINEPFCPECGGLMAQIDHRNENGALYVWYECSRNNCDG